LGYETEVSTPKSDSDGLVALDAMTVEVMSLHGERQAAEAAEWGDAWTDTGYVFTIETGEPVHPITSPGTSRPWSGMPTSSSSVTLARP
jgi:hypothetical protein